MPNDLEVFLKKHRIVGLDTMLFIYQFEKYKNFWQKTQIIFSCLEEGKFEGVTSVIGLIEILTKPKKEMNHLLVKEYQELLTGFPNLTIFNVDLNIADLSSSLRAKYNLTTPDAIIVATALIYQSTGFITADIRLKKIKELDVFIL
ncbi:MAG: Q3M7V5 PilT like protein [Berkelbacteria bacterium GW2011_GWA1_36_9]|uniref:Q3M7V5 PilT like protein n=1 Tax=Berkelbacteria bacterium GW2011_GWA1_36_9 TaxID=1618331 RepID=A0A0G0IN18_9BACT|nr:MAG: Q3M7V5 PilT like protein [Berkelbacteria bacterium GW2011_GWA1_36_9]